MRIKKSMKYSNEQIEAGKKALDEWTKIYLAPTSVPFELAPNGSTFRGMNNLDKAIEYAGEAYNFFRANGLKKTVFVVKGPTSTTKSKFEVVTASAGYTIAHRKI